MNHARHHQSRTPGLAVSAEVWITQRRELLDAASEAPWEATFGPRELARVWTSHPDDREALATITGFTNSADGAEDARLIADVRTSMPLALDALTAVLEIHANEDISHLTGVPGSYNCLGCNHAGQGYCPTRLAIEVPLRATRHHQEGPARC